jgi:dipeptidyl aminopeptidase/acylaminoacyl peptidase
MKKTLIAGAVGIAALAAGIATYGNPARAQENRDIVVTAAIPPILLTGARPEIAAGVGTAPTSWFRRVPSLRGPVLSPDGTKIAVRMSNRGRDYVAWLDLDTPNATPNFFVAMNEYRDAGDRTVANYRWVGNDTIVFTLASREIIFGGRSDLTRLVAYNINTRQMTQLAWDGSGGAAANILHINHDTGHILLERQGFRNNSFTNAEVLDVDVRTGRYTNVQRENPEIQGWIADPSGVIRAGSGYDARSGRTRVMYRRNASDNFRTLSNQADPSFTDAGLNILWVDPNSDMALVRDNREGYHRIYRVNLSTLEYGNAIFRLNGYDVDGVRTNFDRTALVGFTATEQRARSVWTDGTYREIQSVLDETFGAGNATISNGDRAGRRFTVYASAPNQAGAFYLFDTQSGQLRLLGNVFNNVGMTAMNPVSAFRYTASDGESIEAIMTFPRQRQQRTNLPLVIITHGGPFGPRDEVQYDPWAQAVAEMGYVVVQPNYRGSGGYGRRFQQIGRDNGFGLRMQDDLNDVITHLAREGTIDSNRVCMMGWSYGGYASARAAQRDPDKYRCTIAGAGVYDLAMMREYDVGYLGNFGSNYLAKGAAELNTVSPARNTDGRWAPIMIVHGVRDARVPVAQARTLVSRLRSSGKVEGRDFEYIEQPQNTHNLDYDDVHTEWLEGAARWLTRWNPAYIASDTDRPVQVVPEGERPQPRRQ